MSKLLLISLSIGVQVWAPTSINGQLVEEEKQLSLKELVYTSIVNVFVPNT
jgi:hypothetical protein